MAEIFNPKEDVIKLELTSYGIDKMKNGELEPVYYSFHDDEVYYGDDKTDQIYYSLKKDDFERIYKDSAYVSNFKTKQGRSLVKGVPTDEESISLSYCDNGKQALSYYNASQPLGNSKKGAKNSSAISVYLYDKKIDIDSIDTSEDNIKEINLGDIDFHFKVKTLKPESVDDDEIQVLGEFSTNLFEDETFIDIEVPDILLSIDEANVESEFENFEIEVYEYDKGDKRYIPLLQPPIYQDTIIKDGMLIDGDNERDIGLFMKEYEGHKMINERFFIEFDDEIPDYILEKYFNVKRKNLEDMQDSPVDIYTNTLSGPFGDNC